MFRFEGRGSDFDVLGQFCWRCEQQNGSTKVKYTENNNNKL